jgi:phenylacetate-CoA ligase
MALLNVVNQIQAFTYASVISGFDQATMARINLNVGDWESTAAPADFLAAQNPQVITGDPATLEDLLAPELRDAVHPLALFSGAMALTGPLRRHLEDAFGAPVFDLYGLHETRPIAMRTDDGPFRILPRRLVVEILDATGAPVSPGETGEIVVTAGENPLLPLVRYRTGDFARLLTLDGGLALADLEAREYTRFRRADGSLVVPVDITQQLQAHGALGWAVEQAADGSATARVVGGDMRAITSALEVLFHAPVPVVKVGRIADLGPGKPRRYVSHA